MRTFLCTICILLLMLVTILIISHRILTQVETMLSILTALPDISEAECAAAAASLEAIWCRAKPMVGLAVNGRVIAEIDRLMTSLRVTASFDVVGTAHTEWERDRELLIRALEDLRKLLRCGIWEIV